MEGKDVTGIEAKWEKDLEKETNLSEMFDHGFDMYNHLNKLDEPTNSSKVQSTIRRTMNIFENCTRLVSLVDMFSGNEGFEEIPTENIKYFLLPALLGTLTTKICGAENRMHLVDVAELYFVDFLKRLKSYGLIDMEIPDINHEKEENSIVPKKSNAEMITEMVNTRNTKIQRYQEQKELEKKLDVLRKNMDNPNIDEEDKREYFVTLVKMFASQAIDELSSLAAERPILEHMKKIAQDPEASKKESQQRRVPSAKLQPIIITRDAIQKKVYGAGYPSLPVLTVQEFYDQKVRDGEWPEQRNQIGSNNLMEIASGKVDQRAEQDREDEEKETQIENDDPETLARARAMDEYKDDHRRGWGNRANRS
ncbi:immunoglobulin-binding protein 1 [Nasonia vitripennis]|uniref:Immunoglobulin-binding protein 1 n=1 Tax=Nasonia vitripennis TaxID=7425 RepID=A0A7M7G8Z2_NASVI|nr:immunoglobulin-binding protein 1 [Nasonia vitripennis]